MVYKRRSKAAFKGISFCSKDTSVLLRLEQAVIKGRLPLYSYYCSNKACIIDFPVS